MGYWKDKLLEEQEAVECPECGGELEADEEGGGYSCPNTDCEATYDSLCGECNSPMNQGKEGISICPDCFSSKVNSPKT